MSEAARGYNPQEDQSKKKPDLKIVADTNEEMEVTSLAESMMESDVQHDFKETQSAGDIQFGRMKNSKDAYNATQEWVDRMLEDEAVSSRLVRKNVVKAGKMNTSVDYVKKSIADQLAVMMDGMAEMVRKGKLSEAQAQENMDKAFGKIYKNIAGEEYPADAEVVEEGEMPILLAYPELDLNEVAKGKKSPQQAAEQYLDLVLGQEPMQELLKKNRIDPKKVKGNLNFPLRGVINVLASGSKNPDQGLLHKIFKEEMRKQFKMDLDRL